MNVNDVVYADYQSSKPVDPRVVEAMMPYFGETFGNAASLHGVGDQATAALDEARARVARFIGAEPTEIVFTSGATEASNLAIIGYCLRNKRKGDHVLISEAEHISILNIAKYLEKNGFRVTRVPIDLYGRVSPPSCARASPTTPSSSRSSGPTTRSGRSSRSRRSPTCCGHGRRAAYRCGRGGGTRAHRREQGAGRPHEPVV